VQWERQSLAVTGQIEPVIALERLDLRHPGDEVLDVRDRTGLLIIIVERAHRHLPGVVGHVKRLDVTRLHSGSPLVLERGDAHLVEIVHQKPRVLDRLVTCHRPELVAQETDRRAAVERASQLALVVLLDLDSGGIGCGRSDPHRLERRGVGIDAEVEQLQRHRIVRCDAVKLCPAEAARFVHELLFRPAPQHDHPFSWLGFGRLVLDQVERFSVRRDAVEPHFAMPVFGGAHVMRVVIDQPRDDGAPIEIHHARERPLVRLDLGVAADRQDAFALDRQRLGNREPVVHRDDLAVE